MDDSEPSVLTYTEFRNRQLLQAWRQRQLEYEARHLPHKELDSEDEPEELQRPPPLKV